MCVCVCVCLNGARVSEEATKFADQMACAMIDSAD